MQNRNYPACYAVALRAGIFTTIVVGIACLALSPIAQAVVPPPDGGYPGGNTAVGHSLPIPEIKIRLLALERFSPTAWAGGTRPTERLRSLAIQAASTTPPTVLMRSLRTLAMITQPPAALRSLAIQSASTTRLAVLMPSASIPAVTTTRPLALML